MQPDTIAYPGNQSLLDVKGLRKSFARGLARAQSRTFALLDVDISLSWGEVACITGDESAGKTALLQCVAGLLKRDGGIVRWFGEPMLSGNAPRDVIFVSATPVYYPFLTVRDVVHSRSHLIEREKLQWSAIETLASLELDTRLNSRVADLSRSELRCLSIAEALVQRPLAVLVDTSPSEMRAFSPCIASALREFVEGGGAAMIALRDPLPLADAATRIVMLHEGSIRKTFYSDAVALSSRAQAPLLLAETLH